MTNFTGTVMAIAMLGAAALAIGGYRLRRRGGEYRTKGLLMMVAAAVLVGNVVILTA